ncbi:hypothetical protein [Antarcticimicrobium luteum]|uniref:hypothetical protein n=1 Tax=Antarcticimicrobium luteum TaxID=2547397 RepID=UPI00140B3524|nr:hypothetical protein [Antarcticimicrobium luteum]
MKDKLIATAAAVLFACLIVGVIYLGVSVAKLRYDVCRADGWNVAVCIAAMGR